MTNKINVITKILIIGVTALLFHAWPGKLYTAKISYCPLQESLYIKLTDEQKIKRLPYGNLVWKVYGDESGYGRQDWCRLQGKYNGFGYAIPNCYGSLQKVAELVSAWFTGNIEGYGLTIKQSACLYNTGKVMNDCPYYYNLLQFDTITAIDFSN